MEDKKEPNFIDMETLDLTKIHNDQPKKHTDQPKIYTDQPKKNEMDKLTQTTTLDNVCLTRGGDYHDDAIAMIVKHDILTLIDAVEEYDSCDTQKSMIYKKLLVNMLISNGNRLEKNQDDVLVIENAIFSMRVARYTTVLLKIINNIKTHKSKHNIHFRELNEIIRSSPPISEHIRKLIEDKLPQMRYNRQRVVIKEPPQFKVDQIVGARDKTGRWWLSRVLHVHSDPGSKYYWYYVHFEGWSKITREWICSKTYSIRKFNPKKHYLKRS